ncbi:MAG: hypothetical protein KF819_05830 [Labilithrix sp.]|nr:hypothetical protein [Labilithrix sp.]
MLRSNVVTCCICAICGVLSSGCSFLFVKGPPINAEKLPPSKPVECTTSRAAPVVDAAVTAFQVVRTVYAIKASDTDYWNVPISRGADIGLGVGLTTLFGASMIYGLTTTSECIDAKERHARRRRAPRRSPVNVDAAPTPSVEPAPGVPETVTPTEDDATPAPAEGDEDAATGEGASRVPAD